MKATDNIFGVRYDTSKKDVLEIQELTHQMKNVVSLAKMAGVTGRLCGVFSGACDTHNIIYYLSTKMAN